ncbi:MAG: TOBE domain-containing protein, partial [Rhodospirillales bacterium]
FVEGAVLAREADPHHWRVATPSGALRGVCQEYHRRGEALTVSIRPEDLELTEAPVDGADGRNALSGTVDQKVFLGEYVDFQVKIGETILLARAHPSLRTPIGNPINVRIDPEKCIALPEDEPRRQAA